ncbi:MAG: hypothetical protein MUO23_01385 [Anaerolineales bacterium]|nr:hypothetical protein [Anaerolineales bacterium]
MAKIFGTSDVGKKNIALGIALFAVLGILAGIPLTINFFGGSVLTPEQYTTWKVVHAYGVFLGFIGYFYGLLIDRLNLSRRQKELSSWCFLLAGVIGGFGRMALALFGALGAFGVFASLGEVVFFVVGTAVFVLGQMRTGRLASSAEAIAL